MSESTTEMMTKNLRPNKILVADDDMQSRESTRKLLEIASYYVECAEDGVEALEKVRRGEFDLVISDVRMPRMSGLEFLKSIYLERQSGRGPAVILMTAFGRIEDAVWAMKFGAVDFLTKPFKRRVLLQAVEGCLKRSRRMINMAEEQGGLIGSSSAMQKLRGLIAQVAPTAATVLIKGESGTGKELVARLTHQKSARKKEKFIALNCAAIPENLIEAELFGFQKGTFTGAFESKLGLFEAAQGGTLLLDEIGDMPLALQAKLLRVLQEREIKRLGETVSRSIDVRVLAATHQDLNENVKTGKFRQDLLYRLEVVTLKVPSLRERREDILELCGHFLEFLNHKHSKNISRFTPEALSVLQNHFWPGNVRELLNTVERSVVFCDGVEIGAQDLPPHLMELAQKQKEKSDLMSSEEMISFKIGTSLKDVEEKMIQKTLEATAGDKNKTAQLLGVNSRTIYRKLEKREEEKSGEG